jgi:UDP-N-acetylmuramate--alanine ligase
VADPAAAAAAVAREARSGDVVITLGAGDVWKLGDRILEQLRGTEAPHSTEAHGRRSETR